MPFTQFECIVQRALNVAPTQLHPNSWGFIRGFEILCRVFMMNPKVGIFFAFYQTKGEVLAKWIYLTSHSGRRLLTPYVSLYMKFKQRFFQVRGSVSYPEMLVDDTSGAPN